MKRPCLDCGRPTSGSRCDACHGAFRGKVNAEQAATRKKEGGRPAYGPVYRKHAAAVRASAFRCWLCGEGPRMNDPWQADHVIPIAEGGGTGPLAPAHRSCNVSRANRSRVRLRRTST